MQSALVQAGLTADACDMTVAPGNTPSCPSGPQGPGRVVVRPRQALQHRPGERAGAAASLLAGLFYALRFHGLARIVALAVGAAVLFGVFALLNSSRRRTKLALGEGNLTFTSLFRRERVTSPARVVAVELAGKRPSGRRTSLWAIVNASGKAAVALNRDAWDGAARAQSIT